MKDSALFDSQKNNIFIFWHQGFQKSPQIIQECFQSWKEQADEESWIIHELHEGNLNEYLELMVESDQKALRWFQHRLTPNNEHYSWTKYSDLLRLCLLDNFGGVWADSTVFCMKPLRDWILFHEIYPLMPQCTSSFDRITEMWLIASKKSLPFLKEWKQNLIQTICFEELKPAQNWNFHRRKLDYWLKRLTELGPRFSLIWLHYFMLKWLKKSPYFIAYFCLNMTLRNHKVLNQFYNLILPFDSNAWMIFQRSDWLHNEDDNLLSRIQGMNFIKLDWKRLQEINLNEIDGSLLDNIISGKLQQ